MTDGWVPDRRRSDRRLVPSRYQAWVDGADAPMRVRELGPGGIVIESACPLATGQAVRVVFDTGEGDGIGPLHGRVAHTRMLLAHRSSEPPVCLTGIAFAHVAPEQAARIATALARIDRRHPERGEHAP